MPKNTSTLLSIDEREGHHPLERVSIDIEKETARFTRPDRESAVGQENI